MAHITVNYKMFLPAAHHRQPRNANMELALAPTAGGDTPFTPPYFPLLPYTLPDGNPPSPANSGNAQLLFWSDTDGTTGVIRPPNPFDIPAAASARTVTGWYFPISGPGTGTGPTVIIDDAFSANKGAFIDDTFVDVTSDPSLTANANVIGIVPTTSAQTLVAKKNVVSTSEPFHQWILNDKPKLVGGASLAVPQGTQGIAIAIYQDSGSGFQKPNFGDWAESARILFGVIQDGGGLTDKGPVGPWDPLITRLRESAAIAAGAGRMDKRLGAQLTPVAAQDAIAAIKAALPALEKLAGKTKRPG